MNYVTPRSYLRCPLSLLCLSLFFAAFSIDPFFLKYYNVVENPCNTTDLQRHVGVLVE